MLLAVMSLSHMATVQTHQVLQSLRWLHRVFQHVLRSGEIKNETLTSSRLPSHVFPASHVFSGFCVLHGFICACLYVNATEAELISVELSPTQLLSSQVWFPA